MTDMPIACTLSEAEIRDNAGGLLPSLIDRARGVTPLPEGVSLRFDADGDVLAAIARVVEAERRCCRFLRFRLTVEPDAGPMTLDVTGPPGTGEFLRVLATAVSGA